MKTPRHLKDAAIEKWLEDTSKRLQDAPVVKDAAIGDGFEPIGSSTLPKKYMKYILMECYILKNERQCLPSTWGCPVLSCDEPQGTFAGIITHLEDCEHLKDNTRQYICPWCSKKVKMLGHIIPGDCQEMGHTPDEIANDEDGEDLFISVHKILLESEAYQWLVSVMQRTIRLDGIDPSCMAAHRENITRQWQSITAQEANKQRLDRLITSQKPPPIYIARFSMPWDLLKFLREEYGDESPAEVVGQVVTLTGDGYSVQAATCREYLEQVWSTTGSEFMNFVEDMITQTGQSCERMLLVPRTPRHSRMADCAIDMLPDRTVISARLDDESCVIEAFGTQNGLGDVTEQLLWISTSLRTSSVAATGISLCSAELVPKTTLPPKATLLDEEYYHECLGVVDFDVVYTANPLPEGNWLAEGDCWIDLFTSCPLVIGYPIPTRKPRRPGLEIPLDIMAALIGADRITPFGHDLIIKGYSDLFYATERHAGCIMWHLICNKGNPEGRSSRISFADRRIPQSTDQSLAVLQPGDVLSLRHIVGWTNIVRSNAGQSIYQIVGIQSLTESMWPGAPDIEYSRITSSDLKAPQPGWALDRVQITAGQYITVAAGFVRGKKDKPIHRIQEDYISRLLDIRETRFILCDVETRKAWLVNGLSTLLHMVRSHLAYAENDELRQAILLVKGADLQAEGGRSGLQAAFQTLISNRNRMLQLHRKGGTSQTRKEEENEEYYYLEDLVKSLLHSLEQIVDHQSDFRSEQASAGYRIKTSPWAQLEGFDFMDVASARRRFSSRGMKLHYDGKGWSQLTRALEAPTLFGQHFGEILEPASAGQDDSGCAACHWNEVMPPGRDLLAVQMEDILKAGREDKGCERVHFADGSCLDVPSLLFEPCPRDNFVPVCQDRITRVQGASMSVQASTHPNAHSKAGGLSKMATTGAILLGMPREPSADESQEGRGFLRGLLRNPFQSMSLSESPQARVSASPSNSTTADNSHSTSNTSRAQTEDTPLTPLSNLGLLPNCPGDLRSPSSVSSTPSQPSIDDYHRRKRALRRQEQKK